MSEVKVIKCDNCGSALPKESEYKDNMFECPFCNSISYIPIKKVVYREPVKELTYEENLEKTKESLKASFESMRKCNANLI